LIRVKNIIKRNFSIVNKETFIQIDKEFKFDILKKELFCGESNISLSKKERDLLALFLQNRGKILSKEEILSSVWEFDEMPSEQSLRVYIGNIRKIIGEGKIKNHSKIGYEYLV